MQSLYDEKYCIGVKREHSGGHRVSRKGGNKTVTSTETSPICNAAQDRTKSRTRLTAFRYPGDYNRKEESARLRPCYYAKAAVRPSVNRCHWIINQMLQCAFVVHGNIVLDQMKVFCSSVGYQERSQWMLSVNKM